MVSRLFLASLLLPPLWQSCWLAVEKRWGARGSSWMGAWKYFTESILNLSLGWTWKQRQTSMGGSPTWQDCRLEATIPWTHGWVAQHNQGVLAKILVIPDKNNIYQSHFASHPTRGPRVAHKHIAISYIGSGAFFAVFCANFKILLLSCFLQMFCIECVLWVNINYPKARKHQYIMY